MGRASTSPCKPEESTYQRRPAVQGEKADDTRQRSGQVDVCQGWSHSIRISASGRPWRTGPSRTGARLALRRCRRLNWEVSSGSSRSSVEVSTLMSWVVTASAAVRRKDTHVAISRQICTAFVHSRHDRQQHQFGCQPDRQHPPEADINEFFTTTWPLCYFLRPEEHLSRLVYLPNALADNRSLVIPLW